MAGHSKWSKVKHIKGVLDVRRGKLFSKLSKEITVAARLGGGNPDFNPRLRAAVQAARDQSMPADNIERAINKGTGELASEAMEEMTYEGYGPAGVAFMVETATDNKNRTAADLRTIFGKNGGNLAASGSVAYQFHRKGMLTVPLDAASEEQLLEALLAVGAEDLRQDEEHHCILTPPDQLYAVGEAIRGAGFPVSGQKLTYQPETINEIADENTARKVLKLCDALEDCDDVLQMHANFDLPDDLLSRLQAGS